MTPLFSYRRLMTSVPLALALAVCASAFPSAARAQPLSSGSGSGTGTGMMGGASGNTTGTGMESGSRGFTGTGSESGSGPGQLPSNDPMIPGFGPLGGYARPRQGGPGGRSAFDGLLPADNVAAMSVVTDRQLEYARRLATPSDRSLALSRIASAATFSAQLDLAETALNDASKAAEETPPGVIYDQRMISIIQALMYLAEARLREGSGETPVIPAAPDAKPDDTPAIPKVNRDDLIRKAQGDWRRAAALAQRIGNPTYSNELMYRVADSMAYGSQTIINAFPKAAGDTGTAASGVNRSYAGLPDQILQDAGELAGKIRRPVWHDRAYVAVSTAAAESRQFARAVEIARRIPQPEVRSDALLKVAELQARRGDEKGATATYHETALSVANIPLADVRAVLAGVLIDNLISVGRFEDARKSIALYPDMPRRLVALEAIAESQGKRGAAASALAWIHEEIPEEYQSRLYRRVNNGVVSAIESNRSRDLSAGGRTN